MGTQIFRIKDGDDQTLAYVLGADAIDAVGEFGKSQYSRRGDVRVPVKGAESVKTVYLIRVDPVTCTRHLYAFGVEKVTADNGDWYKVLVQIDLSVGYVAPPQQVQVYLSPMDVSEDGYALASELQAEASELADRLRDEAYAQDKIRAHIGKVRSLLNDGWQARVRNGA